MQTEFELRFRQANIASALMWLGIAHLWCPPWRHAIEGHIEELIAEAQSIEREIEKLHKKSPA